MAANLKSQLDKINTEFTNTLFSSYMQGLWGITVGYKVGPIQQTLLHKQVADWQNDYDCQGELCDLSRAGTSVVARYPGFGKSPFPQISKPGQCFLPPGAGGLNATPQNVVVSVDPLDIEQFTVGASNGPIAGTSVFQPIIAGSAYLTGKVADVALGVLLTKGIDYTFDTNSGTITLLHMLFNTGDVYTIFSY